jgi:arginyl-tRNA synthetase
MKQMNLFTALKQSVTAAVELLYGEKPKTVELQETRKEFEGDVTLVVFPLLRLSRKAPEQTATEIGDNLVANSPWVEKYQVVKGFLNLTIKAAYWLNAFKGITEADEYGFTAVDDGRPAKMVEYSSPNTNKPLHLGHIRNNLLGASVARISEATGNKVYKVQIVNDRGIHICKSMIAWQKFGHGETPESSGLKGDHLVGRYYVAFDKAYKAEIAKLVDSGMPKEQAEKEAPIMKEAQDLLRKWEAGDAETVKLWETMNGWVYSGFAETYEALGVGFDRNYYESQTYILGKADVEKGLEKGVFFRKDDGSVWIDLSDEGLDEKLVLRSDGTSVYMTQDIGTAIQRFEDFDIDALTYVVGSEQEYHFKVLFLILKKLGYAWADQLHHLSYGMVDLPTGRMKSREGTVVDADDLIAEMVDTATKTSEERGKLDGFDADYKAELNRKIGLGALKYFILKVDPRKRMVFNPEESIDFNGNTGPFIQYTFARIQSLKRKSGDLPAIDWNSYQPVEAELNLIQNMLNFPAVIAKAAETFSPSELANYAYNLVKAYNGYYQKYSILGNEDAQTNAFRLQLSSELAGIVQRAMYLLGIDCPERM